MDELNINSLPAEILTEIFRYLNVGDLKKAAMTCKLWNNLIKSAFRWSLRMAYNEHGELLSKYKIFTLKTDRKFKSIVIDGGRLSEDYRIVKIFKKHGSNVAELHLHRCRIHNLRGFAKLLTFTPNLKHADVQIEIPHGSSDVLLMDQLLPDLKKLKSLMIRGVDFQISKCFRKAKLTTMEIRGFMIMEHRSLMVDFLSTQDKLTTLAIYSHSPSILVEMGKPSVSIPFLLTQLSISGIARREQSQNYEHLQRFVESQAANLTEIQMNFGIPRSVYEYVFTNMAKLTTLWVMTNELPQDNDFYDQLTENRSVHTVRLLDNHVTPYFNSVGKFLQKFPNIRVLILMCVEYNILQEAQSLSKLESLHIERIHYGISLDGVKLPNLKTLNINYLRGKNNWNEFTKAHPMLTELTIVEIEHESNLTSDDIDQMTTNVDLQCITFGVGFVADNRFFEIVGSNCKNLKVLDLHKSCISQTLEHYMKINVLRLRDRIQCPKVFRLGLFEIK